MDVDAFVAAHQPDWWRLDALVKRRRALTGAEVDELVTLYQRTATHLSAVRSAGYDPALVAGLSSRVARARAAVTGSHVPAWQAVARFAVISFPAMAYRARWWWLGAALGSILVATALGWWIARSPGVQAELLPRAQVRQLVNQQFQRVLLPVRGHIVRREGVDEQRMGRGPVPHLRRLLGLPTLWLLFLNAANAGIDGGLMIAHGKGGLFFALILPHGMLELPRCSWPRRLGLRLGWCVIDPGPRARSRALAEEGRASITIALGLIVVLLVSGVIEAFVTPSPLPTWARILDRRGS